MSVRLVLILLLLSIAACSESPEPPSADESETNPPSQLSSNVEIADANADIDLNTAPTTGDSREIDWDSLIPDDYRPDKLMADYDLDAITDDDPRAAELMDKLRDLWDQAPVREDLDGKQVKLPGFLVPVEADENETTGFLLVPYYGACIHVPPPPANQTVYVVTQAGEGAKPELFDVIWVTGTMSVNRVENDIAEAGYTLYASNIEPYE